MSDDEFRHCVGDPCTMRHVHELHGGKPEWPLAEVYEELILAYPMKEWARTRERLIAARPGGSHG